MKTLFLVAWLAACSDGAVPARTCRSSARVIVSSADGPISGATVALVNHDYNGWGATDAAGLTTVASAICDGTVPLLVSGPGIVRTSAMARLTDGVATDVPITVTRTTDNEAPFIVDCAAPPGVGSLRVLLSEPLDVTGALDVTVQSSCATPPSPVVTIDAIKNDVAIAVGSFDSQTCTTDSAGTHCTRCIATSATVTLVGARDRLGNAAKPSLSTVCTF